MSGRSAYVRKKITETKVGDKAPATGGKPRAKSSASRGSDRDDVTITDLPSPSGTGFGTTNARFLKFSEQTRDTDLGNFHSEITNFSNNSSGSQSGGSDPGRRDLSTPHPSNYGGPMPEYAYARARRPVIRTEDVSGIEKSGLRTALDKRSEDVRKGISKAFSFGKKSKKGNEAEMRPPSSATLRPSELGGDQMIESVESPPIPAHATSHGPAKEIWDSETPSMPPPPSGKLPPLPATAAPPIKRWIGAGRPVQRWNKLRKDPELWDPNGDVLVYFGQRGQTPRPNPSFRLSSHIIEATESRFLVTLLREGSTEEDIMQMPPSPMGAPPMLRPHVYGTGGQPTPPISEDNSLGDADGQISYEMYFPTPPTMNKVEALRYAITTRNVFALLYHASLVGLSLFQALSDLHARLDEYMPPEADNLGTIINYLTARGIDDTRNDPDGAISFLAWAESVEVRWEEGWREAFLHAAGMFSRVEGCADFKHVTPISRALLERACLETQLRVQAAEERLAEFSYADAWPTSGLGTDNTARAAADRLQKFFISQYTKTYGSWPPQATGMITQDGEDMWLTRTLVQEIQKDFGALYDYLVNRDIVWDESETRSSRKWMMVSESGNRGFNPDTIDLPMTDMLIEFDNRLRYPHIPHPYPLVPESIPASSATSSSGHQGREKLKKEKPGNKQDDRILERRVQLAYTEATNIYVLGSDFTHTDLIDNFVKFEKSDHIGTTDPSAARRGRWVLIYCILQTLASVSVDSPNLRYKNDVGYHLSPRLKGTKTPPWKGISAPALEANHELSHCWTAPRAWNNGDQSAESDASVTSAGDGPSPTMRMMRSQFPQPPKSSHGTAPSMRPSTAGWHTPGTRSVRSSGTGRAPTTSWGGSSAAMSVSGRSDDSSSIRTPSTSAAAAVPRSVRSYATFGRVNEEDSSADWPIRKQSIRGPRHQMSMGMGGGGHGIDSESNYDIDEVMSHRSSKPLLSGGDSDGLGPVIRDFDILDVVDDHAP